MGIVRCISDHPMVSIPFSSGRRRRRIATSMAFIPLMTRFNPLLIGETAPPRRRQQRVRAGIQCRFNPLLIGETAPPMGCIQGSEFRHGDCFNPLLIGETAPPVFAQQVNSAGWKHAPFQSPSHRGRRRRPFREAAITALKIREGFNPLLIGETAPPSSPALPQPSLRA